MNTDTHSLPILIKYHSDELEPIKATEIGDWIDLRSAERVELKEGEFKIIPLGVSMKLPDGYEAHLSPRSSTCKNFGIIQPNSVGVIDNSYCGDDDIWGMPVIAVRDTVIDINDRICQFRIMPKMPPIDLITVNKLSDTNRGGFGSTGTN